MPSRRLRLRGFELELQRELVAAPGHTAELALSYTRLHSRVERAAAGQGRLQGQPEYLASAALAYRMAGGEHSVSVFYKRAGDALYIVSDSAGVPDVYLQARSDLRLSYVWRCSEALDINVSLHNALDERYHYVQGDNTFLSYRPGRAVQLGVELRF